MRVLRGRAADPERDFERTREMAVRTAETGEPALRAWRPHRQVAFGRRDARSDGYDLARGIARNRGYVPLEREVGGRAVAYTGSTVAFALARPADDRSGIRDRYADATDRLRAALADLGVDADEGEPPDSFCPGTHSLRADGKIAGLAQRVRQDVALVAGVVVVADREEIAAVLDPVYDALDVPFDPDSVGSVAAAGSPSDPDAIIDALIRAFVPDDYRVERIRET
ncbi:lipoyl protein ligase domain-containing protein [Halomicrobium urmianum]|uniref:lipoyl protein ligase domain-containing protein n=1 Tax=Halomicrobium urmianum TaxID=1586233 RepID=UPI001CD9C111|nr:lipoate--protein ligase family protein [Halomicrobium urmianum]